MAIPLSLISAIANMAGDAFTNVGNFARNKSLERRKNNLESYNNIADGRTADFLMNEQLKANKLANMANYFDWGGEMNIPYDPNKYIWNPEPDGITMPQSYRDSYTPINIDPMYKTSIGLDEPKETNKVTTGGGDPIGGLVAAVRGLDQSVGSSIGNDYHSNVGDVVNAIPLMSSLGGAINRVAGVKTRQDELLRQQQESNYLANTASRAAVATSFDDQSLNGPTGVNTHVNPYKAMNHTSAVVGSTLLAGPLAGIGASIFNRKAHEKAKKQNELLSSQLKQNFDFAQRSTSNAIDNIKHNQINNLIANTRAYGGPLDYDYSMSQLGLLGNIFGSQPNTFAFGGMPEVNTIGAGGSHEENPNGGVPMGIDKNGVPNLVEEGEATYNNYVFSDRLEVPEKLCKRLHIKKGSTFAEAAEAVSKEAEERGGSDPIANAGKESQLADLRAAQEVINNLNKAAKSQSNFNSLMSESEQQPNMFSGGGPLDTIDSGFTSLRNGLDVTTKRPLDPETQLAYDRWGISPNLNMNPTSFFGYTDELSAQEPLTPSTTEEKEEPKRVIERKLGLLPTEMRYASIAGPALGLGLSSLPETYDNPKIMENMAKIAGRYTPASYTPTGEKLNFEASPLDIISSQIQAQGAANEKGILASANLNPAAAASALLANSYNTQKALADATLKADMANFEKQKAVSDFNRATDAANAQGFMKAAAMNNASESAANELISNLYRDSAKLRQQIDAAKTMAQSSNLTSIFDNIGSLGRENLMFNMINTDKSKLYSITPNGEVLFKKGALNPDGTLTKKALTEFFKSNNNKKND